MPKGQLNRAGAEPVITQKEIDDFFWRKDALTDEEKMRAILKACLNPPAKKGRFVWKPQD